jgi:hypothetical protein
VIPPPYRRTLDPDRHPEDAIPEDLGIKLTNTITPKPEPEPEPVKPEPEPKQEPVVPEPQIYFDDNKAQGTSTPPRGSYNNSITRQSPPEEKSNLPPFFPWLDTPLTPEVRPAPYNEPAKTDNVHPAPYTDPVKIDNLRPIPYPESAKTDNVRSAPYTEPAVTDNVRSAPYTESAKADNARSAPVDVPAKASVPDSPKVPTEREITVIDLRPTSLEPPPRSPVAHEVITAAPSAPIPKTPPKSPMDDLIVDTANLKHGYYYVQIATMSDERYINILLNTYRDRYNFALVPSRLNSRAYSVLVGPLTADEYGVVLNRFQGSGYGDAFVKKIP